MSAQCEVTGKRAAGAPMSLFERWLTLWVGLSIAAGVALGPGVPVAAGAVRVRSATKVWAACVNSRISVVGEGASPGI